MSQTEILAAAESELQALNFHAPVRPGEAVRAMCFMAGANSIFYGDKLLTTGNPDAEDDPALLAKLGLKTRGVVEAGGCK
jgi:biotin synthase-like enzyme